MVDQLGLFGDSRSLLYIGAALLSLLNDSFPDIRFILLFRSPWPRRWIDGMQRWLGCPLIFLDMAFRNSLRPTRLFLPLRRNWCRLLALLMMIKLAPHSTPLRLLRQLRLFLLIKILTSEESARRLRTFAKILVHRDSR